MPSGAGGEREEMLAFWSFPAHIGLVAGAASGFLAASNYATYWDQRGRKRTDQVVAQRRRIISVSQVSLSLLHRLHAAVDGPHQGLLSVTLSTATATTKTTTITQKQLTKAFLSSLCTSLPPSLDVFSSSWITRGSRAVCSRKWCFLFLIIFKLTLGSLCALSP